MQKYTVIFAFIGFYLVGLPLSYVFTFIVPLDIYGFWLGIMSGEIIIDILFFILIWRFDWNMVSKEASARTRLPSVISMRSRANSSSSINTNEHIQLLPYKSHLKNDALSGENAAASIQSDKEEKISDEKRESEPLSYESITIKLLVFIVFFCIFIISCIHNFE